MIEMNRDNIRIDPVLEVDTDWSPPCISAYIEIWFDADEKFGTHTHDPLRHLQPGLPYAPDEVLH